MTSIAAHKLLLARNIFSLPEDTRNEIISWLVRIYSHERAILFRCVAQDMPGKDRNARANWTEIQVQVNPHISLASSYVYSPLRGDYPYFITKQYRKKLHHKLVENIGPDHLVVIHNNSETDEISIGSL